MSDIAIYCTDPRLLARVRAGLGPARPVVHAESWQQLERLAARTACVVVVLEWLRSVELVQRLEQLVVRALPRPVVLVTAKDADAVRQLSRLRVAEIVWPYEVDRGLAGAVERALGDTPLERIRREVEGQAGVPPRLRRALVAALVSTRPVVSVEQAAEAAGCDRRTLWRELRELDCGLRLQDVLDWILLVRLGMVKVPGRKWSGLAEEVGVHEHTLGRMIRRLTGVSQRRFGAAGAAVAVAQFEERVLRVLLDAAAGRGGRSAGAGLEEEDG